MASGPDDAWWCGYFGYAARPDLPARPDGRLPDAVVTELRGLDPNAIGDDAEYKTVGRLHLDVMAIAIRPMSAGVR